MTRRQPIIRQNPDPSGSPGQVHGSAPTIRPEWCPEHGCYIPPRAWLDLRRRAVSGQEPAGRSRDLLEAAARIRRRCRECQGQCLTGPEWARRVRLELEEVHSEQTTSRADTSPFGD